jgi:hypothetical protein
LAAELGSTEPDGVHAGPDEVDSAVSAAGSEEGNFISFLTGCALAEFEERP